MFNTTGAPASLRFGSATDSGTIVLAPSFTSLSVGDPGGLLAVEGGILRAGAGTSGLPFLANHLAVTRIDAGATLDFNGANFSVNSIKNLQGSGTLTNSGATVIRSGNFSGTVAGAGGITKTGSGILTLSGPRTFTGPVRIDDGLLHLAAAPGISAAASGPTVRYDDGIVNASGLVLGADLVTLEVASGTATQSGGLSEVDGPNGIEKIGAGMLILGGPGSYTGTSRLSAGGVTLGDASALGTGGIAISGGSLRSTATGTLANSLRWEGGESSSILSAAAGQTLTFTGPVAVFNTVGAPASLRFGSATDSGTIILAPSFTSLSVGDPGGLLAVEGGILRAGAGTSGLPFLANHLAVTRIDTGATLDLTGANFLANSIKSLQGGGTLIIDGTAPIRSGDFAGTITGTGGVTKLGGDALILSGSNSFTGGLVIAGGTVSLGSDLAAGGSGSFIRTTGSVIDYADGVDNATPIEIASDTTQLQVLTGSATQSGVISEDAPPRGFEKIGDGILALTAVNTYTGTTTVSAGALAVSEHGNLGNNSGGGNDLVLDGATAGLLLTGNYSSDRKVTIGSAGGAIDTAGFDADFDETSSGEGVTFDGLLRKQGNGTLNLYGEGFGNGGLSIEQGTVALWADCGCGGNGAAGTGTITIAGGATLAAPLDPLEVLANDIVSAGSGATPALIDAHGDGNGTELTLEGTLSGGDFAFINSSFSDPDTDPRSAVFLTGNNTYGATSVGAGVRLTIGDRSAPSPTSGTLGTGAVHLAKHSALAFGRSDTMVVGNVIDGEGAVLQRGRGTTVLAASNSYSGRTRINRGTLQLGAEGALGTGGLTQEGGTLDLAGFDLTLTEVFGTGGRIRNSAAGTTSTLTLDVTGCDCDAYLGNILDGAGVVALVKQGSGSVLLAGNNDYSGGTLLSDGVLGTASDSALGTGGLVQTGGTLDIYGLLGLGSLAGTGGEITTSSGGPAILGVFGGTTTYAGTLRDGTGPNVLALTIGGSADLTLGGSNDFSGGTGILDGTLRLGAADAFGTGGLFQSGGTLDLNGFDLTLEEIFGFGGQIGNFATGTASTLTIDPFCGCAEYSGDLIDGGGTLAMVKTGPNDISLAGNNSYSGGTLLSDGGLIADSPNALGIGGLVQTGGELDVYYGALTISSLSGTGGRITTNSGGLGTLVVTGGTTSYAGTLRDGDGMLALTLSGSADLTLTGTNSLTGGIIVDGGSRLRLGANLAAGGAANFIETTGSVVSYANGVDNATPITIASDTTRLEVLGADSATQSGVIDEDAPGRGFEKIGTGTLTLSAANSYSGTTRISEGTLAVSNGGNLGDGSPGNGLVLDGATARLKGLGSFTMTRPIEIGGGGTIDPNGFAITLRGEISGGDLALGGAAGGNIQLYGDNSYGATTVAANTKVGVGMFEASGTLGSGKVTLADPSSWLLFGRTDDTIVGNVFTGSGLIQIGVSPGKTITLTGVAGGTDDFTGELWLNSGTTLLNGTLGDHVGRSARMTVGNGPSGAALSGGGTFLGDVFVTDNGVLAPGNSPGTLTIGGDLTLSGASVLNYELGQPGVVNGPNNDLIVVGGDLRLDGVLNVTAFGSGFGPGYYRLINYGGTLDDHLLSIGSMPAGFSPTVTTNVAGQVNLLFTDGATQLIQYWDGTDLTGASNANGGDGGAGTWTATSTNWTTPTGYSINDQWRKEVGVFAGAAAGLVTVDGTQAFQELRFQTDGYRLVPDGGGGALETTGGFSIIDTAADVTARLDLELEGAGGLTKAGAGTLVLGAAANYGGATSIAGGTLRTASDLVFASNVTDVDVSAGATFDVSGTLQEIGALSGGGGVLLGSGRLISSGSSSTFSGAITGDGTFRKVGSGLLTLTGTSQVGTLDIASGGALRIGATGSVTADLVDNRGSLTNAGAVVGPLFNAAAATVVNGGSITGDVTNSGSFSSTGSVEGNLANLGGASTLQNQMLGNIAVDSGSVTLTGTTTGIDGLDLGGGSVSLGGFATSIGSLSGTGGEVRIGGTILTVGSAGRTTSFAGTISQSGGLTKVGTGTLTLGGSNTYTGTTTISAGTLALSASGAITSNVVNDARFTSLGSVTGDLQNAGTARIQGRLSGDVANPGVVELTGTTIGVDDFANQGILSVLAGTSAINTLGGAGAVTFAGGNLSLGAANGSMTISGAIGGSSGSLTKTGTGPLTLSGANTFTGSTRVLGGTLAIASGSGLGGTVENQAVLQNGGRIGGLTTNSGSLSSIFVLTGLSNSGSAQVRGELNGAVANSGTLTLTGATTGIDALTQTTSGTFDLAGNDVTIGSLAGAGNVQLGSAALRLGGNEATTDFAGTIAGAGSVTKTGTGAFTLSGANSYAGGTAIEQGTLAIAASGSVAGDVGNSATFSNAGRVGGVLVNAGVASNSGTIGIGVGNLGGGQFTNSGTVNGGLGNATGARATNSGTITGGVSNLGELASSGTIGGTLDNSGTASLRGSIGGAFNQGSTGSAVLTGALSVAGNFTQAAPARLDLAGFDAQTRTISGAGTITLGSGTLTTGTDGVSTIFAGTISGAGRLVKTGAGNLILTGSNDIGGGTTISAGAVQIGNGGTTGTLGGPIVNNAFLIINRSDALTLAGPISGTGMVFHNGTGTTTLTGANSYSGGTRVSAGRLVGNTVSLQGDIRNDANLEFAQAVGGTYAGRITGTGMLEKTGAGLLTMSGDSGTFTGGTFVRGGGLNVAGSLARSVVTIGNGGTLFGNGIVGGIVAQAGGTVAPGNSVGVIHVAGDVTFAPGSTYLAEVDATGADLILATGRANLAGTIAVANSAPPVPFGTSYLLLHADFGRNGTFGTNSFSGFNAAYRPEILYTANDVLLRLAPNSLANIAAGTSFSPNQQSTLDRIDAAVVAGYSPQPLFPLYFLGAAGLPGGLDALSGEIYATTIRVLLDDRLVREATLDRLVALQRQPGDGDGAWFQAVRSWGSGDADGLGQAFDSDVQGFIAGLDHQGSFGTGSWQIGLQGHWLETKMGVDMLGSRAEVERAGAGIHVGFTAGGFAARMGANLAKLDLDVRRDAVFTGYNERMLGSGDGLMFQAFGEIGYSVPLSAAATIEPFASIAVTTVDFDPIVESGTAALEVRTGREALGLATIGVRGSARFGGEDSGFALDGSLGIRHAFGDRTATPMIALAAAPLQGGTIWSQQIDRHAVTGELDARYDFNPRISLSVGYSGVIGADARDHAAKAKLSIRF
ncbi:autotransporter-associated beta strand repeat-containing protein [Sphingomonas parva]|uniref:autotransporter-associated beta strand repeat-containing protein n=1 Tax=Sphingomonas parva TaxID=2555898 RepID=UPI001CDD0D2B|nr:autotransporter-associated beta strand repeat-containing protein [Sphingomonas parva]